MCNAQKFFVIGFGDFTHPHTKYNHLRSHNLINCRSKHQAKLCGMEYKDCRRTAALYSGNIKRAQVYQPCCTGTHVP